MKDGWIQEIEAIVGSGHILRDEPMEKHTTFRIGGPADALVQPGEVTHIQQIIKVCRNAQIPYYVIGNGSNLLVSDFGIRGVVIELGKAFSNFGYDGDVTYRVQAGCMLSQIANQAYRDSLTGLEFAAGIPGTIGGAVRMNAVAYGGEMKDVVSHVTLLTPDGGLLTLPSEEMDFRYRHSIVEEKGYIVLEVTLVLQHGVQEKIQARMQELSQARRDKQPLEYPSAGSTFKRPEGYYAGKLIMDAGLAGYRVGDAQVSEKHCGFVINRGHATSKEIRQLMQDVTDRVKEQFGVGLEPEVRMVGE